MQAKHADVCSGVLFWTACTRRAHVLSLPSRCEKPIHDGKQGQLKVLKSHERYHNVVTWHWIVYKWRRTKQRLSFHRTFFNLLVFRCRCHAGTDILRLRGHTLQIGQVVRTVRHWISCCAPTIGNVMRECKIGKSSPPGPPTSHVKTLVIRMSWGYRRCFEWQER